MADFESAYQKVSGLVREFEANESYYLSAKYQESEVRTDFIDKFWIALGWDVRHKFQTNPREQEVKVERNPDSSASNRKADYAFYLKPQYRDPAFFVEAKKPSRKLADTENYFQTVRYGYNASTPVAILMDFEEFHIIDCRYEPNREKSFPSAQIKTFHYKDYLDREKFGEIYWLFSHEALEGGKLKDFVKELPKQRGKGKQKLTAGELRPVDEGFLIKLEEYRLILAKAFKKADESLTAEVLTEATQKVIDRLVFIRFLEDKAIESDYIVDQIAAKKDVVRTSRPHPTELPASSGVRAGRPRYDGAWQSFIAWSKELDVKYNGVVFKAHDIDKPSFKAPDDEVFRELCEDISHTRSHYLFSLIPIEILGSIYERFLGKVVTATAKRADIEEKPEVRKAGGVYYTPKYIVDYIVANTVGKILEGRSADVPSAPIGTTGNLRDAGGTPALRTDASVSSGLRIHSRGYLPHYEQEGSTYFVTFRLADSLPKEVLLRYKQELADAMQKIRSADVPSASPGPTGIEQDAGETPALQRKRAYEEKILAYLDRGAGACYMNNPAVADIVEQAIKHFDEQRYNLYAWAVMPNHVHVLFRPVKGERLEKILHSWKSYSAKEANKILGREGEFWQDEYYDHLVRSEKEFNRILDYILDNPAAANLRNWKWVGYGNIYAEQPERSADVPSAPIGATGTSRDAGGTPALRTGLTPKQISKLRFADIACGSGSFLIAVYDTVLHYVEKYYNEHKDEAVKAGCVEIDKGVYALSLKQKQRILLDNIFGVDIDRQAVEVAQLSLFLKLLENESGAGTGQLTFEKTKILPDLSKNIVNGNSLVEYDISDLFPLSAEDEARIKPFDFRSAFKEVMASGGFDAIVGNPPYGAEFFDGVMSYLKTTRETFTGRGESYLLFAERAIYLLKKGGKFGYIIPDTYLNLGFTQVLRQYILKTTNVNSLLVLPSKVFNAASVDTSILIATKNNRIDSFHSSIVDVLLFDKRTIIKDLTNPDRTLQFNTKDWFEEGFFNVESSPFELQLIRRVDAKFSKIADYCEMYSGIKSYEVGKGSPPQTEAIRDTKPFTSVIKNGDDWSPLFDGKHIGRYVNFWQGNNWIKYGRWLAAPREPKNFVGDKILIRKIVGETLLCMKAEGTNYCNTLLFILKTKSDSALELDYFLGILNSRFIGWYFRKKLMISDSDEFPQIMVRDILTFPIPKSENRFKLISNVNQMLETKKRLAATERESEREQLERKCDHLDHEIDRLVYELYGLTEEEIRIVEGNV